MKDLKFKGGAYCLVNGKDKVVFASDDIHETLSRLRVSPSTYKMIRSRDKEVLAYNTPRR